MDVSKTPRQLANQTVENQAKFLNEYISVIYHRHKDPIAMEMRLSCLCSKLTGQAKAALRYIAGDYKEKG